MGKLFLGLALVAGIVGGGVRAQEVPPRCVSHAG